MKPRRREHAGPAGRVLERLVAASVRARPAAADFIEAAHSGVEAAIGGNCGRRTIVLHELSLGGFAHVIRAGHEVARRAGINEEIRARWSSRSDRWTGKRERRMMSRLGELESMADECWLLPQPTKP